jgi:hypothetical protein
MKIPLLGVYFFVGKMLLNLREANYLFSVFPEKFRQEVPI